MILCLLTLLASACGGQQSDVLRLGTTTSVDDSGLLEAILVDFETQHNATVEVIAVGTGQAIALGELGDVDVLIVHAASLEIPFVEDGYGVARYPVMYNDFVIVGPTNDPAGAADASSGADAFVRIAEVEHAFASRGDNSGTYVREQLLWEEAGLMPTSEEDWYLSVGQGMGATLNFANETGAYTLTDRGTFMALQENLPNLQVVYKGDTSPENPDPALRNEYNVIPINPDLHPEVNAELAMAFVEWLTSVPTQESIENFAVERFGKALFYPDSQAWNSQ